MQHRAVKTAQEKGHNFGEWQVVFPKTPAYWTVFCEHCGMTVNVKERSRGQWACDGYPLTQECQPHSWRGE